MLFVGINPGVRSSLTGHHFAGYSNRFWKLLYDARLVPEPITFVDDDRLPEWGYGITNLIARPTPGIDTLRREEFTAGRARLRLRVRRYQPAVVALVGVTVFRAMFPERKGFVSLGLQKNERLASSAVFVLSLGLQSERLESSAVFVLPNPSGRNANFSYNEMLAAFRGLRRHTTRVSV